MLSTFVLTISLSMPMPSSQGTDIMLNRVSKYTYTGENAKELCERDRLSNVNTVLQPGDSMIVSQCEGG